MILYGPTMSTEFDRGTSMA